MRLPSDFTGTKDADAGEVDDGEDIYPVVVLDDDDVAALGEGGMDLGDTVPGRNGLGYADDAAVSAQNLGRLVAPGIAPKIIGQVGAGDRQHDIGDGEAAIMLAELERPGTRGGQGGAEPRWPVLVPAYHRPAPQTIWASCRAATWSKPVSLGKSSFWSSGV